MRIAAVTIAYNDHYKIREWRSHYEEYRDEIFRHIIVDNGSDPDFSELLDALFPDSIIIKRAANMGTTAAYNEGIRYALEDDEVDSLLLIGNDIRLPSGNLSILHKVLFDRASCGAIMPILFSKDSDLIESYGAEINRMLFLSQAHRNEKIRDALPEIREVGAVVGGIHLAKRGTYETIGLQDERLFMYGDEIDMGLRMAVTDVKAMATRRAVAWHQHISPTGSSCRERYAVFLIRRNNIYLAYKHFGFPRALAVFFTLMARTPVMAAAFLKKRAPGHIRYYWLGCICGICRIRKNFRFIVDNLGDEGRRRRKVHSRAAPPAPRKAR